jgi:hypothetical protein
MFEINFKPLSLYDSPILISLVLANSDLIAVIVKFELTQPSTNGPL